MSTPKSKYPPNWSAADELHFAALAARREAFHNHHGAELRKAILGMWPTMQGDALEVAVKNFQDNADRLRDALAPYDSGSRPVINNDSSEG